jgi:sulfatase maturation enzyme AslB (radical SAM superfamily)
VSATAPLACPEAPLEALDTLWLQVAGTLCNLACTHCFISCSPANHAHEMMDLATVRGYLAEAAEQGVREYYFTGGEPFLNREIFEMTEAALAQGPLTILTNGLLLRPEGAARLRALAAASPYSLDLRISLDGYDAAGNDAVRGSGTFARVMAALRALAAEGINPVLTVTEACDGAASAPGRSRFLDLLRAQGLPRPRLKVMPLLRLGAERARTRGYAPWESLAGRALTPSDLSALQCTSSRMATSRGVYVCPILLDEPGARLGARLGDAGRPFTLSYPACHTCHEQGLSCRT